MTVTVSEATAIRYAIALGVLVGLLLPSCAPQPRLGAAHQAEAGPGSGAAVRDEAAGVTLIADPAGWRGQPDTLAQLAAPILVRIENGSPRPLRVDRSMFQLIRSDTPQFSPRPPDAITGSLRDTRPTSVAAVPGGAPPGFSITADGGGFVSGRGQNRGALDYDAFHLGPATAAGRQVDLPSADMLRMALPEQVLAAGQKSSGFLYFEPFGAHTKYAVLQAELVDAETGRALGTVRLPFARAG